MPGYRSARLRQPGKSSFWHQDVRWAGVRSSPSSNTMAPPHNQLQLAEPEPHCPATGDNIVIAIDNRLAHWREDAACNRFQDGHRPGAPCPVPYRPHSSPWSRRSSRTNRHWHWLQTALRPHPNLARRTFKAAIGFRRDHPEHACLGHFRGQISGQATNLFHLCGALCEL